MITIYKLTYIMIVHFRNQIRTFISFVGLLRLYVLRSTCTDDLRIAMLVLIATFLRGRYVVLGALLYEIIK
jgi:hypothetical protein